MKKQIALLLCLALLATLAAGCGLGPSPAPTESPSAAEEPVAPAELSEPTAEETASPEEPAPAERGDLIEEPEEQRGHYVFQPKVCSSFQTELFGQEMVDTWYNLVDAVMAGETTFACPDAFTYNWVMGQFPDKCFPVLPELIDYCWDREHPVKDGMGSFVYLVPPEEAAERIAEFERLVEDILNSTLEDDYSDVEKALALYLYFADHYVYDYEAARPEANPDYLSSYRVLSTGTGICQEFSVAYAYLLLQAGVDATNMSGHRSYDRASHQWTYVKINGHNYHIDPTYVIGDPYSLEYFMMDDAQREAADGYLREEYVICSNYAQDHPHPDYTADDDSFRPIWTGRFLGMDHENRILRYSAFNGENQWVELCFDYSGW